MGSKPKVIVICGATASGKTSLSVELAKQINGEIISADSMQIYKDMDIGTAKVTKEEMQGIKHYMVDIVSPDKRYSVADFKHNAECAIEEIIKKGKTPIIAGGTGLYINSLIYNINYPDIQFDEEYRKKLEEDAEQYGLDYMYNKACEVDPDAMKSISVNDKKRILRVLEIYNQTGKTKTQLEYESRKIEPKYDYCVYAIEWDRDILYERINKRVDLMIKQGLIEEVKSIIEKYDEFPTAMQGLGYKEVVEYLQGKIDRQKMIEKIKMETRRYAKRQITWFKKIENIKWIEGKENLQNNIDIILEGIK